MSSEEATLTSPLTATEDVLRRFDAGGVEGGAAAAVAFFLPRGMSGMTLEAQHNLDCRDPILWEWWVREMTGRQLGGPRASAFQLF